MNKTFRFALGALSASTTFVAALAAAPAFAGGKPVDLLTAVPAESEKIFTETIERAGGINTFAHARKPATVDTQTIVRSQKAVADVLRLQSEHASCGTRNRDDAGRALEVQIPGLRGIEHGPGDGTVGADPREYTRWK